ncbi:putative glutathione S-transferase family protein [Rickenella mellea]|uniref:Putative glutathione S-transferase family protein n=1 Tax=Rickenella mellea TaxID=50990 RepID=A0A4Y7PYJ8_9AGAM|nr:putative glutathione S-transferase family protein [Rickenella mellea]
MTESTEHRDKKIRVEDKYKLLYWPGLPGRGEPVRLAFEEAGADYEDVANCEKDGIKVLLKAKEACNAFAPPMLQHGDLMLSQTPNIMLYLGPRLKLVPETEEGRLLVNQYFLTASDCQNEAHDTHHPISVMDYYEDQKDAALAKAKSFRATRIPKFFKHFESVLSKGKGEWLVGDDVTYADLMLFHLVDGLKYAFPRRMKKLEPEFPKVFGVHERVAQRPRIAAYLKSDRRQKYGDGIYRYYEELDGDE